MKNQTLSKDRTLCGKPILRKESTGEQSLYRINRAWSVEVHLHPIRDPERGKSAILLTSMESWEMESTSDSEFMSSSESTSVCAQDCPFLLMLEHHVAKVLVRLIMF